MKRLRLFYGWYIVFASLLVAAYFSAIFTYGWTAFIDPIRTSLGWSLTTISLASTLRGVESGIFNPMWGRAVDRLSPTKLMSFGVVTTGVGILIVSFSQNSLINSVATYYLGFFVMGLGSSLATSMVPSAILARWFHKDIGKANGVFYMGVGIGGVLIPVVVKLVDSFGWQETLMYSAVGYMIIGVPLSFVLKRRPEDVGQVPDGWAGGAPQENRPFAKVGPADVPVGKALRMRAFWYLSFTIFVQGAVLGVISQFAIPYLTNLGISRDEAGLAVLMFTVISLVGRFSIGFVVDVFPRKYVQSFTIALLGVGLLLFWRIDAGTPFWLTVVFALAYGLGIAGIMPLRIPLMVEYFGTRNIGSIFGLTSVASTLAGVSAAPLAARVFDVYHTYKPSLIFLVGFSVLALVLMLTIPAPPGQVAKTQAG